MKRLRSHPTLTASVAAGLLYLLAAWIVTYKAKVFVGDDLARLANGYYVLFSRQPHLAAVGFAWNPLPSFLMLPFMIVLRPLGALVFASALVTVLFSAMNVGLIYRVLGQLGVGGWPRTLLVLMYAVNPFVVLYAANGMTEALFISTMLLLVSGMIAWMETRSPGALLGSGIACALSFGMRMESIMLVLTGMLVITLAWWSRYRDNVSRLEGEQLAFIIPFIYVVGLWLLTSWLITGTPLYFINGAGNSAAQSLIGLRHSGSAVAPLYHHLLLSAQYLLVRTTWLMPATLPLLVVAAIMYVRRHQKLALVPLLFPASVLVFHLYLLYSAQSFGELRYYCYSLPLGILCAALVIKGLPSAGSRSKRLLRRGAIALILLGAAVSFPSTLLAMNNATLGRQEHVVFDALRGAHSATLTAAQWGSDRSMATYLDGRHLRDGSVVLDTTTGFSVELFSHNPKQFIIPSDADFEATVAQLAQFHGYVLVARRTSPISLIIKDRYPELLSGSVPWAQLQHHVGSWYFYRIRSTG